MPSLIAQTSLGPIQGIGGFIPTAGDTGGTAFTDLISVVIGLLTVVAGLAFMLYFILGGINWLTAGGNADKVEAAKNQMTNAGIGLIIVVAAYTITGIVSIILGFDILNPADALGL